MSNLWHGEKVRLRAVEPRDFEAFRRDGIEHADDARLYGDRVGVPRSEAEAREAIERQAAPSRGDDRTLAIENAAGDLAGSITAHLCDRLSGNFSFGLGVFAEHRRRGYGAEAVRVLLRYFFDELRYQKANSKVYAFNEPSLRLHEHLGFADEGRTRRTGFTDGAYHDDVLFGMTVEEFHDRHGGSR